MKAVFPFLCILLLALFLAPSPSTAANRDVCPSCAYHTISDAIAASQSGDKIRIAAGTYEERASLNGNKSLTLEGGYSADFSQRDVDNSPTIVREADVNFFNVGDEVFDGLTITGLE